MKNKDRIFPKKPHHGSLTNEKEMKMKKEIKKELKMNYADFFIEKGWAVVNRQKNKAVSGKYSEIKTLPCSDLTNDYLSTVHPDGIYRHQAMAIKKILTGENLCLSTGTASGKSLVFQVGAIEKLRQNPGARIIAVYPMKALGFEQEKRWREALQNAGLKMQVGRIDGDVKTASRAAILRNCNVVVMTPDIIHAWLLHQVSDNNVKNFLQHSELVIIDEIHIYTGVFGSNSAYLFRRLDHCVRLCGGSYQYIAASATISSPKEHLQKLTGRDFTVIGPENDSSPRHELEFIMVNPPDFKDMLSNVVELLKYVTTNTEARFVSFVESRKVAEYICTMLSRDIKAEEKPDPDEVIEKEERTFYSYLKELPVLPYRAGYEEIDRRDIQNRLGQETRGVVSTSALELGLDIPGLDLCILVGVPQSSTSFAQRTGRIGRHKKGTVIIINAGDVHSERVFAKSDKIFQMPVMDSALYLENINIQYIHTLCLARRGGEHDLVLQNNSEFDKQEFDSKVSWPAGFIDLCRKERSGIVNQDLQFMKAQCGEDPNHIFPIRDIEPQFKIELNSRGIIENLGRVSYSQMLREAYPGGIYYYATVPYRVFRVDIRNRRISVRREKKYTTKPVFLPSIIYPNTADDQIYAFHENSIEKASFIECTMQVQEIVCGFKERRGSNEFNVYYENQNDGTNPGQKNIKRFFFTTGIIFSLPFFDTEGLNTGIVAELIFEAFLSVIPLERRDLNFATGRYYTNNHAGKNSERFICIYDQTYGSLRLSSRLAEPEILRLVIEEAIKIAPFHKGLETDNAVFGCLNKLKEAVNGELKSAKKVYGNAEDNLENAVKIIAPGSSGIYPPSGGEEYFVESIFFSPATQKLMYRGKLKSELQNETKLRTSVPVDAVAFVPGFSRLAWYNLETGDISEAA
jgi:DEAD/DEAH box helicase domain-containing protein